MLEKNTSRLVESICNSAHFANNACTKEVLFMCSSIRKIYLENFKRFRQYTIEPKDNINVLIGDNETGKSSILEAIDLVANGNIHRIENIGIDRLMNTDAVNDFLQGDKQIKNLPTIRVELFLNGSFDFTMNGKNNHEKKSCDGIRLICEPNLDYASEIEEAISADPNYFPFDYYSARFSTFADESFTEYRKKLKCVMIDSTKMNSVYATNDFIQRMYSYYTEDEKKLRTIHKSEYRKVREDFSKNALGYLNSKIQKDNYLFGLKNGSVVSLENNLTIYEDNVSIDCKGTGIQSFIKTDFALRRSGDNIDVILIEEPENHLSAVNLRRLIQLIVGNKKGQLFITTHSSDISTRLEINNLLIMNRDKLTPTTLHQLQNETSKYFSKTPPASIVEFVTATKIILVEGPAEFIMLEKFYESVTNGKKPESEGVSIIDVRGLSFKRYLEIAKLTGSKVAVITDNDGNHLKNCVKKYEDFNSLENIQIFYDSDNAKTTYEIVLYNCNTVLCEQLFKGRIRETTTTVQDWMLNNKTEAAFSLVSQENTVNVPEYIKRAIEWIRK